MNDYNQKDLPMGSQDMTEMLRNRLIQSFNQAKEVLSSVNTEHMTDEDLQEIFYKAERMEE